MNQENFKLTRNELAFLEMINKEYKYITRDCFGEISVYQDKPKKSINTWGSSEEFNDLPLTTDKFPFITWDNTKPYSINDLIELGRKQFAEEEEEEPSSETRQTLDNVNHPSHYNVHKHECIDEMIAVFGVEAVMTFCKLTTWKYRYRAGAKDGESKEKDLAKADWYMDKLTDLLAYSSMGGTNNG